MAGRLGLDDAGSGAPKQAETEDERSHISHLRAGGIIR